MRREIPIRKLPEWKRRELGVIAYWETTYIYGLQDPRDSVIRYVGQSINTVERFKAHCRQGSKTLRECGGPERLASYANPNEQMTRVTRYLNKHFDEEGRLIFNHGCCIDRAECIIHPHRFPDYIHPNDCWLATLASNDLVPHMIELDTVPGRYEKMDENGCGESFFYDARIAEHKQILQHIDTIYNWTCKQITQRVIEHLEISVLR